MTIYVDPILYERVRCAAYTLGEDIYVFAGEALSSAIDRRMSKPQRSAVEQMAQQNVKNVKIVKNTKNGTRREKR